MMQVDRNLLNRITALVIGLAVAVSVYAHVSTQNLAAGRSFAEFSRNVAPILADSCSARDRQGNYVCHGRPAGRLASTSDSAGTAPPRLPHVLPPSASTCSLCHAGSGRMGFAFALSPSGRIDTDRQRLLAFEQTRLVASRLARMPLGAQSGGSGLVHPGGEIFESAADPGFQKLEHWAQLDRALTSTASAEPGRAESFFRDRILPVLARRTCMAPACHTFNHASFTPDAGTSGADLTRSLVDRFTPEQVSYDRATSKGLIQSLVYLTGQVEQSRILKKIIPIMGGGMLHRGGNDQFLRGRQDPDYDAIKRWLQLERREAAAHLRTAGQPISEASLGKLRGLVFVRTRRNNCRHYLDVGRYQAGADLFLLKLKAGETLETASAQPLNLTARFHRGTDADIREPNVRWDGRAVLFAMRKGRADRLNIYEIGLDENLDYQEGSFRRLTYGPATVNGIPVHCTDPTYVPDPTDENAAEGGYNLDRSDIVFSSNLSGRMIQSTPRETIGEADGGDRATIIDRDRPEPDGSFVGRHLFVVDGTNRGAWRTITAFKNHLSADDASQEVTRITLDRPLARPVDASTVYAIQRPPGAVPGFLPGYSVYGMKIASRGREKSTWAETVTRLTFNPGQDQDLSVRTTGEIFYASQRSTVDREGRPVFNVASCRRHLDTRFSFPTHHGNRSHIPVYASSQEMPDGLDIHVGMDADSLWGGTLIVSDHQFGPDLEPKNPNLFTYGLFDADGVPRTRGQDISNTRFIFKHRPPSHPRFVFKTIPLFPERGPEAVTWTGVSPRGAYRNPAPLPDGSLVVSHARGPLNLLDAKARPSFDLYVIRGAPTFQPVSGQGIPRVILTRINATHAAGTSAIEAAPIYVRFKPKINAGRRPRSEHLIRYPGTAPDTRPATYLERNYLLIDAIMRDPSPSGKHVAYAFDPVDRKRLEPIDRIAGVRFVEVLPMTPDLAVPLDLTRIANHDPQSTLVCNGISPPKRLLGTAPLCSDGSVYCKLPSNTPMLLQSINADGMALRQEARCYAFAPNEPFSISPSASETFRTCGACMGSETGRPEDLFGPILPFAGQDSVEAVRQAQGNPTPLGLAVAERRSVDFPRDVQPILDHHCVGCHGSRRPAAGLALTGARTRYYNVAYESLMRLEDPGSGWYGRKKYLSERDALAIESYLMAKLLGRQLKASRPLQGDRPHPSAPLCRRLRQPVTALSEAERRTLTLWIDLGAAWRGAAPENASSGVATTR